MHCGDASVLHHAVPEMVPPQECIPERFQEILLANYSDSISLSGPTAAARPLYYILELIEPSSLWPQIANKTEDWPVKFSALLDKLQHHGFCSLKLFVASQVPLSGHHWKSGSQHSHLEFQDVVAVCRKQCTGNFVTSSCPLVLP